MLILTLLIIKLSRTDFRHVLFPTEQLQNLKAADPYISTYTHRAYALSWYQVPQLPHEKPDLHFYALPTRTVYFTFTVRVLGGYIRGPARETETDAQNGAELHLRVQLVAIPTTTVQLLSRL